MQQDEILKMVITELTERGHKRQRSENPEVNELVLRRIHLSEQVQECFPTLAKMRRIPWRNTITQWIFSPATKSDICTCRERRTVSPCSVSWA